MGRFTGGPRRTGVCAMGVPVAYVPVAWFVMGHGLVLVPSLGVEDLRHLWTQLEAASGCTCGLHL